MIIIGLDPGLGTTGWGVVAKSGNRLTHIANGQIATDAAAPLAERLVTLDRELADVILAHRPDSGAVEEVFVADLGEVGEVRRRPVRHRQHLRAARVDDDRGRPFRRIRFADAGQHPFGFPLDHRVEGEFDVFAGFGLLHRFQANRFAERVVDDPSFAVAAAG